MVGDAGLRALGACIVAIIVGLLGLYFIGAPVRIIATNAAAAAVAVPLFMITRRLPWQSGWVAALLLSLFAATLVFGPEVDGVRRWLALGPIRLHIGMAVVPSVAVAAALLPGRSGLLCFALVALIAALQPDLATALAVFAAALAIAMVERRTPVRWFALLPSGIAFAWCLAYRDTLAPVRFVEGIWADAAARTPLLAGAMLLSLALIVVAPLIGWPTMTDRQRAAGPAFVASVLGFMLASVIGPYPVPLFGGGAAAIIGSILAAALLTSDGQQVAGKRNRIG